MIEDHIVLVLEILVLILHLCMIFWLYSSFLTLYRHSSKRNLFDQKPEGIPEELLNSGGAMGAMAKAMNSSEQQSKVIRRLLITNLPTDYQEIVSLLRWYNV